jgi:sporulation protein YabP
MDIKNNETHKSIIEERKHLNISAVKDVISFDTEEILLDTKLGGLLIKGNELHVNRLDLEHGVIDVEGKVNALIYSDKNIGDSSAKGILARLFR